MVRYAARWVAVTVLVGACAPSGQDATPQVREPQAAAAGAAPTLATSTAGSPMPVPTTASTTAAPSVPAAPRPPSAPATAILKAAVALEPAGAASTATARVTLVPGSEVVVDPAATFEVELTAPSSDARLVLVDARDDLVGGTGTREVGPGTRLTLAPAAPLVPGSRYALRLDGASDRDLHDGAGRAFSAVTLPLLAAGSPPPPEPKKQKPARKKRRR